MTQSCLRVHQNAWNMTFWKFFLRRHQPPPYLRSQPEVPVPPWDVCKTRWFHVVWAITPSGKPICWDMLRSVEIRCWQVAIKAVDHNIPCPKSENIYGEICKKCSHICCGQVVQTFYQCHQISTHCTKCPSLSIVSWLNCSQLISTLLSKSQFQEYAQISLNMQNYTIKCTEIWWYMPK